MANEKCAVLGFYVCNMQIIVLLRCPTSKKLKASSQLPRCNDSPDSWVEERRCSTSKACYFWFCETQKQTLTIHRICQSTCTEWWEIRLVPYLGVLVLWFVAFVHVVAIVVATSWYEQMVFRPPQKNPSNTNPLNHPEVLSSEECCSFAALFWAHTYYRQVIWEPRCPVLSAKDALRRTWRWAVGSESR